MATEPTPTLFLVSSNGGAGLTRSQTRSASFAAPSRGVRQRSDLPATRASDIESAAIGCVDGAVVTDLAAASLWELPLPWTLQRQGVPVSMAVSPDGSRPRRKGVKGRRVLLPTFHLTEIGGTTVTTPARTWLDCAEWLSLSDVVAMGDAILHRGLATEGELRHLLQWGYRRRGMAKIRRAFPMLDGRAESPGESWARVLLRQGGCPAPHCNLDIYADGVWIARVDMAWPDCMVIVEYDGRVHLDERQRRRDAERLNALQAAGWRVIVLTADDLRRPEQTLRLVLLALNPSR